MSVSGMLQALSPAGGIATQVDRYMARPDGVNGAKIYDMFHKGPGTGDMDQAAQDFHSAQQQHSQAAHSVRSSMKNLGLQWQGAASESAGSGISPLGSHADDTAQVAGNSNNVLQQQSSTFHTAKNSVQPVQSEPPQFGWKDMNPFSDSDFDSRLGEYQQQQSANQTALKTYGGGTHSNISSTPQFNPMDSAPPKVDVTSQGGSGVGGFQQSGTSGSDTGSSGSSTLAASAGGSGSTHTGSAGTSAATGGSGALAGGSSGATSPTGSSSGSGSGSGLLPGGLGGGGSDDGDDSDSERNGAAAGVVGGGALAGSGGALLGRGAGTEGGIPGRGTGAGAGAGARAGAGAGSEEGGLAGRGGAGARGSAGSGAGEGAGGRAGSGAGEGAGGRAGSGARSGTGLGSGTGSGSGAESGTGSGVRGPGGSSGTGNIAAEEAAATRPGGARGMGPGMAGMPGARGNGEEDEEHKSPDYLVEDNPNALFGTSEKTPPPVLGED